MQVLEGLQPHNVFKHFEKICSIPHGSYNEKAVSDYCVEYAEAKGLWVHRDELNNVIIKKPASPGFENRKPVIIQGHLDMVCEKDNDIEFDFEKMGLQLFIDGDWIGAKGTTLGGDDGVAVAMGLALLDEDIPLPAIELVFTVAEEVGMEGAFGIDLSGLEGEQLLNLDSEEEGYFLAACAGGQTMECILPVTREEKICKVYRITVDGLFGGHSGAEIHKERGNANVLMARLIRSLGDMVQLVSMDGGLKDNAIPRECTALVATEDESGLRQAVGQFDNTVRNELFATDSGVKVTVEYVGESSQKLITKADCRKIMTGFASFPNGVCAYCQTMPDTVETSLNMGIVSTKDDAVVVKFLIRSSVVSRRQELYDRIALIVESYGGQVKDLGSYPAWEYTKESPLRDKIAGVYRECYGKEAVFQSIHAGLECGLLSEKKKNLDCVSFGPDIKDIHTPSERLSISSTARVYDFLKKLLVAN